MALAREEKGTACGGERGKGTETARGGGRPTAREIQGKRTTTIHAHTHASTRTKQADGERMDSRGMAAAAAAT